MTPNAEILLIYNKNNTSVIYISTMGYMYCTSVEFLHSLIKQTKDTWTFIYEG